MPRTTDVNPYQLALYGRLRRHGVELTGDARPTLAWVWRNRRAVDVLHVHWRLDRLFRTTARERSLPAPLAALRLARLALALRLARAVGMRIAWTAHEPWTCRPGGRRLDHLAARIVAAAADSVMAHDHASADLTRRFHRPRRPVTVLPLPGYGELMPEAGPDARARVRAQLGALPGETVALAFGVLRQEKDLDLLVDALARLDREDLRVLVAGQERSAEVAAMLRAAAARDPRLRLRVGWMDEQTVVDLHAAADLCVHARRQEWTSASTVLALSLGVPVVAADLRSTAELLGPGAWTFRPGDAAALAATLAEAIDAGPEARAARGEAGRAHVARRDFDALAAATASELRGTPTAAPLAQPVLAQG
jgi:glycosyltransferase involved in cell wall biosynthesis